MDEFVQLDNLSINRQRQQLEENSFEYKQNFFTFNQNVHEQSVINNLIQTSDKYEENASFLSFYSGRNSFMNQQNQLKDNLWKNRDSNSMQEIKGQFDKIDEIFTKNIMSNEDKKYFLSLENPKVEYYYLTFLLNKRVYEYIGCTNEFIQKCDAYLKSHNPYTKKGKERYRLVSELKDKAIIDQNNFRQFVQESMSELKNIPLDAFVNSIDNFSDLFTLILERRINQKTQIHKPDEVEQVDVEDEIQIDINVGMAAPQLQDGIINLQNHLEQSENVLEHVAAINLQREKNSWENNIQLYDNNKDFMTHVPGGAVLVEKYHKKSESIQFGGVSYYEQRKNLTERELSIKDNIINLDDSSGMTVLNEALKKITDFHNLPVLSKEQISEASKITNKKQRFLYVVEKMQAAKITYEQIVNECILNYDNYILTHEPKTEKGAKYINELEKMKAMLLEDKKAFENEIENISENFIEEKKEIEDILKGANWINILSISRSVKGAKIIKFNVGNGVSGTTSKYEYQGKKYFRKSDSEDQNNSTGNVKNNIAINRLSSLFTNEELYISAYRVREYDVMVENEENAEVHSQSEEKFAVIMEVAKGKTLRELTGKKNNVVYSNNAKRQLSKILTIDYISGQIDRKDDNLFCDYEERTFRNGNKYYYIKSVQAIDNDQSFDFFNLFQESIPGGMLNGVQYSVLFDHIEYIDKEMYNKILGMNYQNFQNSAEFLLADCGISNKTLNDIQDRLKYVAEVLRLKYVQKGEKLFEMPPKASGVMKTHLNFQARKNANYLKKISDINFDDITLEQIDQARFKGKNSRAMYGGILFQMAEDLGVGAQDAYENE